MYKKTSILIFLRLFSPRYISFPPLKAKGFGYGIAAIFHAFNSVCVVQGHY